LEQPVPVLELFEESSILKGPPKATLVRRAKSYSDFYEVAVQYFGSDAKIEKLCDPLEPTGTLSYTLLGTEFRDFEEDLLEESHGEYQ
jgi:hypothetical protein